MTWWRNDMITFAHNNNMPTLHLANTSVAKKGLQGIRTVTFSWQRHDPLKVSTKCLPLTSRHFLIFVVLVFLATRRLPSIHPRKPKLGCWVSSNFIKVWLGMAGSTYVIIWRGFSATSASSSGRFDICNSIHTFEDHEVHVTVLFPMKRVRFFCRGTWMFCAMHRAIFPFPLKSAESNAQLHGCFGPVTFFFFFWNFELWN